nr:bifunctional hydroxymethylpyrimidine kinase/phosphomethylpyrimidine kinase [Corynebacterium flavescens]
MAKNPDRESAVIPRVLSIAGTDPTGGAGIQADLKSITAAGGYGMSVITALVAQNTQGVRSVHVPPLDFLKEQLACVADDVEIDAIKIGMLSSQNIVAVVSEFLTEINSDSDADSESEAASHRTRRSIPVVLDPVMVATSGDRLLDEAAEEAVRKLCRQATVITPNLKELAVLTGTPEATTLEEAIATAQHWAEDAGTTVVVKGGHLSSGAADNAVVEPTGAVYRVACPRVDTENTHGTGCSLSSALATKLGAGHSLPAALEWSTQWLYEAISYAEELLVGKGHGPVDHGHRARRLSVAASSEPLRHFTSLESTLPAPRPHVAAAGPHTQRLWDLTGDAWEQITALPFIRSLGEGSLSPEHFSFYLDQDAQYLSRYSKALARLASMAPDAQAQLHWAGGAAECIEVESALHRDWLGGQISTAPSPITNAYTDFLIAATHGEDYVIGVAAVLPCYWLYAEVGLELAGHNHPEHPYHDWLSLYAGEDFINGVRAAIAIAEKALAAVDEITRERACRAYLSAAFHEVDFFDQADRRG